MMTLSHYGGSPMFDKYYVRKDGANHQNFLVPKDPKYAYDSKLCVTEAQLDDKLATLGLSRKVCQ